ncbi:MAG: DUF1173 family protein, partial [Deferrisomatales bacterium]|nr:DUF1173 family protein [Deferrisomatales bacterium]
TLRRGDWRLHAPACPLRRPPISGAPRPARPTVETLPDGLVLNLSLPRYRLLDAPEWEPHPRSRGELAALLRVLREAAGLDLGDPAWDRGSCYADARHRLLDAADRIHLRGVQRLADWLYIPPRFQPAQNGEITTEFEAFLERLEPRERRAPYGFFLGALAEIREGPGGGKAIRLAHTFRLLWFSQALWRNLFEPGKGPPARGLRPRSILLAQASRKTQRGWLMVRDAVLLSAPPG